MNKYREHEVIDLSCGVRLDFFDPEVFDFSYDMKVYVLVRDERGDRDFHSRCILAWNQDAEAR